MDRRKMIMFLVMIALMVATTGVVIVNSDRGTDIVYKGKMSKETKEECEKWTGRAYEAVPEKLMEEYRKSYKITFLDGKKVSGAA